MPFYLNLVFLGGGGLRPRGRYLRHTCGKWATHRPSLDQTSILIDLRLLITHHMGVTPATAAMTPPDLSSGWIVELGHRLSPTDAEPRLRKYRKGIRVTLGCRRKYPCVYRVPFR